MSRAVSIRLRGKTVVFAFVGMRRSISMVLRTCVGAGLMLLMSLESSAQIQTIPDIGPNFIGVELLGRAFLYSINYGRYVTTKVGIGAGMATWEVDNKVTAIIPMYMSVTPIGVRHKPYLSAGMTVGMRMSTFFNHPTAAVGTAAAGYEFTSSNGFTIRPTLNMIFDFHRGALWPGMMIGRRF
jgi:hypothetical protein